MEKENENMWQLKPKKMSLVLGAMAMNKNGKNKHDNKIPGSRFQYVLCSG